ncbi:MAG: hypothetical protein KTR31_20055 [Myxococcales bacterium]|nr:hypothetical protein [Myxococcales bacterium]
MVWWLLACVCSEPPRHLTVRQGSVRVSLSDEAAALQTPVITLHGPTGGQLALVGTVHVGDPGYYDALSVHLADATVVLHEGLLAEDDGSPVVDEDLAADAAYLEALDANGLATQGETLLRDDRWVRADMTVGALEQALRGAGATDQDVHDIVHARDRNTLTELFASTAGDPRRAAVARLALIESISETAATEGRDADLFWEVVIGARNALAVAGVAEQEAPELALIYGADHTADLAIRLETLGFHAAHEEWVTAIEVPYATAQLGRIQVQQLLGATHGGVRQRRLSR